MSKNTIRLACYLTALIMLPVSVMVFPAKGGSSGTEQNAETEIRSPLIPDWQLRLQTRRKKEDIRIRQHINAASRYLEKGDIRNARKYAYRAWAVIPHDTQVAVLIADINKKDMFGPAARQADDSGDIDDYLLNYLRLPPADDPLLRHEERKSFADLGEYLLESISGRQTFELGEVDTERQLTMDDCVEIAIRNNPRFKMVDEQIRLGELRLWETRRRFFPDLTLRHEKSFGKIGDPATAQQGATRHYQGEKSQVEMKHSVFDGFGTLFEIRQMQTNLEVMRLERQKVRNEIIEETERAYYNLDKAIKNVSIQESTKNSLKNLREVMESGFREGIIPEVDFLKVKGFALQSEFQYISGKDDVDLAEMVLFQAMDIEPDHRLNIEPVEKPEELIRIGLQNCYNLAISNNPNLSIKEKTIEYFDYERKVAKAKGWPKVDFHGSFGTAWEAYQPMRDPSDITGNPKRADTTARPEWFAGLTASVPFLGNTMEYRYVRESWSPTVSAFRGTESATSYFNIKVLDNLGYFTGAQEARVGFERAKYEFTKEKKDLTMKIKALYFKYRKALIQMNVAKTQLAYQSMFVDVMEERRRFGEMDIPRLAEEYIKLGENRYAEVQADANYFISITELNAAIGVPGYFDPWGRDPAELYGREMLPVPAADASGETDGYLSRAREALARSDFSRARRFAVRAIEAGTDSREGRALLGDIDLAEGIHRAERAERRIRRGGR